MTMKYEVGTVSEALPVILQDLLEYGEEVGSRNGRVKELLNTQIVLTNPVEREVLSLHRKTNVFAQIAETMWVLSGRSDIEWLSAYLPRAKDYSDDGVTWRGGYGRRIRNHFGFDQLRHVVKTLHEDPLSRRAVISIYDPRTDVPAGKDVPCNDFLQFQSRGGSLHLTVTVRSNDAMWGWSGINAFEWSTLQEIVASLLGIRVGTLTFNIGNLHIYEQHWGRASRISYEDPTLLGLTRIRFDPHGVVGTTDELDRLIYRWFVWEEMCRTGKATLEFLDDWDEPLFKSWAAAIAYFWTRDPVWLLDLRGTALGLAVVRTPASVLSEPSQTPPVAGVAASPTPALHESAKAFYDFVKELHAEKDASYGDSWMKRGEKMSILANMARKVDRIGVGDKFDSSADTWIDFMVYAAKYLCWINEKPANPGNVNQWLSHMIGETEDVVPSEIAVAHETSEIVKDFDFYADNVDGLAMWQKHEFVAELLKRVTPIAREAWLAEDEYRGADVD